ncbi:MAG: hypothetical protein Q4D91_05845 [Lautropia sp.]|nr:hypothetical protein [Lautropia sp.]
MNSSSSQHSTTDLPTTDRVNDPCSPDRSAGSGGLAIKAAARVVLTLGSAAVLAACSTTGEQPGADYSRADSAVSSSQGPIKSPAAERVVGGIVDMVLSGRLVSSIDEARKHPVGLLRDGQPLYLYIQSTRPLGELAHPADPYSKHSFSSYPHLFVQVGDNHSMRILNTCYVTLTPAEAKAHALVVPLAPLSKRVGDVPSDCWLETMTQAERIKQTLEVRLAGFPGRFESWLPVPDLLGVEAVDVDLRQGVGVYAGMLRADPKAAPALVSTLGAKADRVEEGGKARAAAEAARREANAAEAARKAREQQAQAEAAAREARAQKAREAAEAARLAEQKRLADEQRIRDQAEAARVAAEAKRVRDQAETARLAEEKRARDQAESVRPVVGAGSAAGAAAAAGGAAGSAVRGAAIAGVTAAGAIAKGAAAGGGGEQAEKAVAAKASTASPAESARMAAQQAQAASLASRRGLAALPAGARLAPVTPLLPAKPRNVGGTRMAVQLRSLTATLLGRQPSETYFTDRQWQTQPGRSRRDARQTIHAIAVFRGEECSWQSLLVSRRPNASTIAEVAADGDEVPIACPDLDR